MKKPFSRFEKFLTVILATLLAIIAAFSVWAVVFRDSSSASAKEQLALQSVLEDDPDSSIATYSGMGRLRVELNEGKAGVKPTLIIAPVFLYDKNDRAWTEELASHIKDFRKTTIDYLSALNADSPELFDEAAIKSGLISRYNKFLRLGKINTLYFTDYMIID